MYAEDQSTSSIPEQGPASWIIAACCVGMSVHPSRRGGAHREHAASAISTFDLDLRRLQHFPNGHDRVAVGSMQRSNGEYFPLALIAVRRATCIGM